MIYKAHHTVGNEDKLDSSEISQQSEYFNINFMKVGNKVSYDNGYDTYFEGTILGFDNKNGRNMYVQIGDEYTVIDALGQGHYIVKVDEAV